MVTTEKLNELKAAFNYFDSNKDGTISPDELKTILAKLDLKVSDSDFDQMIRSVDKNADGKIEFKEFVNTLAKKYAKQHSKEELEAAFKYFDKDNSGYINESELYEAMKRLNPNITKEIVHDAVKKIDKDNNGRIYIDEFIKMMSE